jgi:type II secretory pathway pseudopilin PulG
MPLIKIKQVVYDRVIVKSESILRPSKKMHCRRLGIGCIRQWGLTLVETVIGLAVLGIVMGSVMFSLGVAMQMMDDSRNIAHAGHILQSEMENLRRMNWAELQQLQTTENFPIDPLFTEHYEDRFNGLRELRALSSTLMEVRLVVSWERQRGGQSERTYVTLMGKDGLNDYYYRQF